MWAVDPSFNLGFRWLLLAAVKCARQCSQNGACLSMDRLSHGYGSTKRSFSGYLYDNWESSLLFGCACDRGIVGSDCSEGKLSDNQ